MSVVCAQCESDTEKPHFDEDPDNDTICCECFKDAFHDACTHDTHTDVFENPAWDWYENPERFVHNRAAFIDRTTDYDELDAHIIAWSEISYTVSGMTGYLDVTQSTVKDHCEDIDAVDETARWSRWPKNICVESPVGQAGTVWEGDE